MSDNITGKPRRWNGRVKSVNPNAKPKPKRPKKIDLVSEIIAKETQSLQARHNKMLDQAKSSGRTPKIWLDDLFLDKLKDWAFIGCSEGEMAAMSMVTQEYWSLFKKQNPIVQETIDASRSMGKQSLRRKQIEVAMKGNPELLKHLGKHYLNQHDKTLVDMQVKQVTSFDDLPDTYDVIDVQSDVVKKDDGSAGMWDE